MTMKARTASFIPPAAVAVSGGLLYQHCINNNGQAKEGRREKMLEGLHSQGHQAREKRKSQQLREERQEVS